MTLKVFDLACEHDHLFEGWFASADAFADQLSRGLVRCPVCDSAQVTRRVSATHLNISHLREPVPRGPEPAAARTPVATPSGEQLARLQGEVLRQMRRMVRLADDVGTGFTEEARRMHRGEVAERAIRGTASATECQELVEEGIVVMPIPEILDDDRMQ